GGAELPSTVALRFKNTSGAHQRGLNCQYVSTPATQRLYLGIYMHLEVAHSRNAILGDEQICSVYLLKRVRQTPHASFARENGRTKQLLLDKLPCAIASSCKCCIPLSKSL